MNHYFPITLNVQSWRCVVVGGGSVASRRTESLLDAGASVIVVAPTLSQPLRLLAESGRIEHVPVEYDDSYLEGARLVAAATNRPDVNAAVARDAKNRGILVNDAGDPGQGDFLVPSIVRRGALILTATTVGGSPALARRIRDELASQYGPEWERYTLLLSEVRTHVLSTVSEAERRKQILNDIAADRTILVLIREGRADEARARALSCISPLLD